MEISEEVVSMSSPKELRLVGDQDIEEYAEALAVELKLRLKDSGRRGNISLPSPEELVRCELDAGIVNEEGFAPRMLPFAAEAADDDFDDIEAR